MRITFEEDNLGYENRAYANISYSIENFSASRILIKKNTELVT